MENLPFNCSGLISCFDIFKFSTTQAFCIRTFFGWISEQIENLTSFETKALLWFNTVDKFRWHWFPRRFNLLVSVLLISIESHPEYYKALTLNLLPHLSVPYAGKTFRNGPGGDCFLSFELQFWLSKGSLFYVKSF